MSPLQKALPLILLLSGVLFGQATPVDCTPGTLTFTSATAQSPSTSNANTATPCRSWEISYDAPSTLTVLSLQFETSPDNSVWTAVPNTVCSSSVQPPCVIDGANPSTTTGNQTFSVAAYGRFVRINVTTFTGTGTLTVRIFGYKGLSARVRGGGGGGGGGGAVASCVPTAYSATPTFTIPATNSATLFVFPASACQTTTTWTANVTSSTLVTGSATTGQIVTFKICQDGTGGKTFAWPTNVTGESTVSPVANTCSQQDFRFDSTNAVAITPMDVTGSGVAFNGLSTPDSTTPGTAPTAGSTFLYTKGGKVCALSPASVETCTTTGAPAKIDYQTATSVLSGGSVTVYTTTIPANTIPAGGCIRLGLNIKAVTHSSGTQLYNINFGLAGTVAYEVQPAANTFSPIEMEICNNPGVTNAQTVNAYPYGTIISGVGTLHGFTGALTTFSEDTTTALTLSLTTNTGNGSDQNQGIWWHVWGPM